jgi:hypothetical protein
MELITAGKNVYSTGAKLFKFLHFPAKHFFAIYEKTAA